MVISLFGYLLDKEIETLFVVFGYFATRFLMPKIKHFDTTRKCISITTITFMFAIALLAIPKNTSLVFSAIAGAIIPLIMYFESLIFDKCKFSVFNCSQEELLRRCREVSLSEENTNLAVEFFIKKTKQSIIADRLCINEKSVQIRKKRLKDKLNNV